MSKPRAYLVDASIYIFRAWHVYDDSICDAEGNPTNAVYGFSEFLYQLIQQAKPDYIGVAFDEHQTDSYRCGLYPPYKANRPPAPEELIFQFQRCREFCRGIGVAEFGSNRFEADDIIGTLAARLRNEGFDVTILSADKDLTQLVVGDEDRWWDFARATIMNKKSVKSHWGVYPEQIPDLLALSGDKVDNIPGIPGLGYKTAAKLLNKFPTVEDLLENLDNIPTMKFRGAARIANLVREHMDILPLNKQLTTIVDDAQFENHQRDIRWDGVLEDELHSVFDDLNASHGARQRWFNL